MSSPRQYKRYSAQVRNAHKDAIRHLVLEEGKKYDEIAAILKADHGFDIGYGTRSLNYPSAHTSLPLFFLEAPS